MKTTFKLHKALILVTLTCGAMAAGCELIVDFDRTKIPVEAVDSGLLDAAALNDGAIISPADGGGTSDADAGNNQQPTDSGANDADADQ